MLLKDVKIGLENIVADPSKGTVQVVNARLETDKQSVIIGGRIEILTRRGSRNPVKLPLNEENKRNIETVAELLKKLDTVEVKLKDPTIMLYSMISNGNLVSGVSVKCPSLSIVDNDDDLLG